MRPYAVALLSAAALLAAPAAALAAPELSTSDRLDQRRYVASGERAYVMGFEDGSFQAQGWHITGEMGGIWSQPLKLIDGLWFGVDGSWVGKATKFTSGQGYVRMDLPQTAGIELSRTDFVPDGRRAALIGLTLRNPGAARTAKVMVDVRSELMSAYPWGWTTPDAGTFNLQDTGSFADGRLEFRDNGTSDPNAGPHDWAAAVGSNLNASGGTAGDGHWGSQAPVDVCTGEDQFTCDDGPYGKGTGGQLTYDVPLAAGQEKTLWIGVAGSDHGPAGARTELAAVLADPAGALKAKQAARKSAAAWTDVS